MRRLGWQAKTTYSYDSGAINSQASSAPGHDQSYDASFTARGNLTSVSRWDVTDIENTNKALTSQMSYDAAGNVVTSRDAANHQSLIGYSDSFPGTYGGTNTFAYPTTVTDADGNSSYAQYNYYFGAKTQVQGPPPANQSSGIVQTFTYDEARRVKRATVTNTGAYSHYEYGPNYTQVYSSVNTVSTDPLASDSYSVQLFDGVGRVFAAAGYHPGSGGGYKAQWTQFDAMGRAMKQSNPTEVTGGWAPAGDDVAGVVYTQQTYDWQGRPLETRHLADGTVKYAEYSGCGCAGGEMVTLTDEVGRQQKVYSDVLGRQWKTEVLNWGGTVYSTRMIAYNTRDQITSARQYQGTDQSGIYQEETETYDGYGRLSTRKAPIQTTATTYTYYANDKPQTATDARGAATTYSYNNRGLVTGVSLTGPAPVPGAISYGYDAAGNRTSMSDETGSTTYGYDQLSRLQSETRQFSGTSVPPGTYTLSYEYNLAGELKAITDPTSSRVDYGLDSNGRLTSVIGSGANSAPTYASNFGYRAWGGVKDFDLGSGVHQHMNFNSRLQNTSFALSNVSSIGTMTWSYDYYADSKLSTVTDSADPRFDRFFDYDHEGRIANALTGSEARGVQVADGPFKQSYGYDVWENTISRSHRLWGQATQTESVPYPNNQHQFWGYDNAGNVTYTYDADFHYDAAGRQNSYTSRALVSTQQPMLEVAQKFDGNGAPASKTETKRWEDPSLQQSVETVFYLRSTALGGKVVAELDSTGYKRKGYIYAGGTQIAQQDIFNPGYGSQVTWETTSPATGSVYLSDTGHNVVRKELDPLGNDVTTAPDPAPVEPSFYNPKWDQMPLQYEGGPSADGGVPDWYVHMVNAQWDMHLAQGYWQSGHRDLAAEIVANNPNVGVQYNITGFGQEPMSGSIFGAQAGAFLNALGSLIDSGQLLQTGGPGFADRRELAHAASKGKRVALSDGTADLFKWARKSLLFELDDADSECSKFLKKTFGFSGSRVAKAVRGIRAWDGTSSTITTGAAGLEPYHLKDGTINGYASLTVSDYFLYWSQHGEPLGAAQAGYKRSTQRDVYFSRFFSGTDILHEALHMFSGGDDDALADKLHVDIKSGGSAAISLALNEGGGVVNET